MTKHPTVQPLQFIALQVPETSEQLGVRPLVDTCIVDSAGLSDRSVAKFAGCPVLPGATVLLCVSEVEAGVGREWIVRLCVSGGRIVTLG